MSSPPPSFDPEVIEAWLDGELSPEEAAVLDRAVAHDPALAERRAQHAALRALLQPEWEAQREADVPYPDFFMHRLERSLEEERAALAEQSQASPASARAAARSNSRTHWLSWLPWGLTAATAAALAVTLIRPQPAAVPATSGSLAHAPAPTSEPALLTAFSPLAKIKADSVHSDKSILLVLDGLPEYQGEIRGAGARLSQRQGQPDQSNSELSELAAAQPQFALADELPLREELPVAESRH